MSKHDQFKKEVNVAFSSGAGVTYIRTKEPHRCLRALRELAQSKNLKFGVWNQMDGWIVESSTGKPGSGRLSDITDPYRALKKVQDLDSNGADPWKTGVYVMCGAQNWVGKNAGVVECIRRYARDFSETSKLRLVLLASDSDYLPEELRHDVPTLDHHLPCAEELEYIFTYVIESSFQNIEHISEVFSQEDIPQIISCAMGMTAMEAELAFSRAVIENASGLKDLKNLNIQGFKRTIINAKTDIVKNSEVLELMEAISPTDVGGLENYKQWIKVIAQCLTKEAVEAGVDRAKGVVVVGPAGTGKTLLGRTTSTILGRPLVRVDISKCFAGIVGQSESRARAAIKQLEAMSPVVALVDEVDKVLGGAHKGGGDSGVTQRVLGIFLTAMSESRSDIFWILTANRVNNLPPEMLRKGRMDEVFAVLPPNKNEREAILKIHLKKRLVDPNKVEGLDLAVEASKGYVSAEIEAAVKEAKKLSFVNNKPITGEDLCNQLRGMKPLAEAFADDFNEIETWARNNAKNASFAEDTKPQTIVRKRKQ